MALPVLAVTASAGSFFQYFVPAHNKKMVSRKRCRIAFGVSHASGKKKQMMSKVYETGNIFP
ncbi:hypothetical protein FW778_20380 [Ginsengibacter hankyongi]|uniref:Uncharacterized protein n=1 Tax=Ginsengibacter hankyongi TaxID=2607284 RepID=A0A5J5IB39_9BACT|nr:hypothetical protein [Ginsengibacter hankyongi]KAA9035908.1 hypothetical protein FW778_20380 [Ginsengibacter hankyongi]